MTNNQLVSRLRQELYLIEEQASDEEILRMTEGTFLRARCEVGIAIDELWTEFLRQFERSFDALCESIEKIVVR